MNKEVKVGALIIFFLAMGLLFVTWIKGNPFTPKKTLHVLFENVHGLSIGSTVEYAGLDCGKVKNFEVTSYGILVEILINNPDIKIHSNDKFIIVPSSTIASEYQIFIVPGGTGHEVSDKASIIGQSTPGMQDFLFKAEKTIDSMNQALSQLKGILSNVDASIMEIKPLFSKVGDLSRKGTIDSIANDISLSTHSIRDLSINANQLLSSNKTKISNTLDSVSSFSVGANEKLKAVNSKDLEEIMTSLKSASNNINEITKVVTPDDVRADIKVFSEAARQVKLITEKLQSPDPNEDVPTLVKVNIQRLDRISEGLEKSLKNKSLFRVLTTKVPISAQKKPEIEFKDNDSTDESSSKTKNPKLKTMERNSRSRYLLQSDDDLAFFHEYTNY